MIALVDCNNFFVSCERLFRPELANVPVAVLSNNDGCVVARSNEVKGLGVGMGVPHFQVKDIFTNNRVTLFSSNFALYSNISQRILSELNNFSPKLEVYSIDEAFMELSDLPIEDYKKWGSEVKDQVQKNVGMPVSVGIAHNKTLAKLASDWAKKHGGVCLLDEKLDPKVYRQVLESSPVGEVWGIGRQQSKKLNSAGVRTAWQMLQSKESWMSSVMGINGVKLHRELSGGVAHSFADEKAPQKSLIASRSFGHNVRSQYELENAVASFAAQAAARLRKFNQVCQIFGVYLSCKDQSGQTKYLKSAANMMPATNNTSELTEAALKQLNSMYSDEYVYKKAGVFCYQLSSAAIEQKTLLDQKTPSQREKQKQLMGAIDEINSRFGGSTMQLATINSNKTSWQGKKELISPAYTTSWSQLPLVKA